MAYDYQTERPNLFTENGQLMFLGIRDRAKQLIAEAGAARLSNIISKASGSSWTMLACVDRLVEIGELVEVTRSDSVVGQDRVFVSATDKFY